MIKQGGNQPALSSIRPLVVGTEPHAGECLSSVLVRACEANVMGKPMNLLSLTGLRVQATEFVPFKLADQAPAIAKLLGTSAEAIESRMHRSIADNRGLPTVRWFGSSIERRNILANVRRYAPRSLEEHQFYPAVWGARVIDYCPTTMEILVSECSSCSALLSWRACRSLSKCDKCGASLLRAKSAIVPPQFHDDARLGAALISPEAAVRCAALSSLPKPFNTWEPSEALSAIITLGEARLWLQSSSDGLKSAGSAAVIVAGMAFIREWPSSLAEYAGASTAKCKSQSLQLGMGPLSRLFMRGFAKSSEIGKLVRSTISGSLGEAVVPAKLVPGLVDNSCRRGILTTAEATKTLRVCGKSLWRLEGRSNTFIARHNVKGGPALYNKAAIIGLSEILKNSLNMDDCARQLGIPAYSIDAFVTADLIKAVNCADALIVTGKTLIEGASFQLLRDSVLRRSTKVHGGTPLRKAMRRVGLPSEWVAAFTGMLSGKLPVQFAGNEYASLTDALLVGPLDLKHWTQGLPKGQEATGTSVSCQTAADIIGTNLQTVSAAVRDGLIAGEVRSQRYSVPLDSVLAFQKRFILTEELCELVGESRRRIGDRLGHAGYEPFVIINRARVWRRCDVEEYLRQRARNR